MTAGISRVEAVVLSCLTSAAESLFATLFPADCRLCSSPLTKISRLPVCEECLASVRPITGGLCSICGERILSPYAFADAQEAPLCGICRRLKPAYVKAAAYGSYEGGLRDLIHLLKYEHVRPAANVLGRMLAEVISKLAPEFGDPAPIVIPVPLHQRKYHERGFNQAELISQAALKLKFAGLDLRLATDVLKRTRATLSQTGLSSHQRRENMRGAFELEKTAKVVDKSILLVDDVFTTGTTISECARVLQRAGARRIWVATVARTLKVEAVGAQIASHKEEDEFTAPAAMAAHV
ncbi:MAG TPA: ComF family protein [Terriglobales bacterium]|nr:ComF family protein [Terriglobales bacterium]